jgi:hypothetical protein
MKKKYSGGIEKALMFIIGTGGLIYLTIVTPPGFFKVLLVVMSALVAVGWLFKIIDNQKKERNEPPASKEN